MKKDLVASTQDGVSVNKKYIRNLDVIGQFCLNHGLHLGACDTLYKKNMILKTYAIPVMMITMKMILLMKVPILKL